MALWSFAKAPLIIGMDMTQLGDKTKNGTAANILSMQTLLNVNQDQLGRQIEKIDSLSTSTVHFYKAVVADDSGSYMGVLVVNWGTEAPAKKMFNMVGAGVAITSNDVCTTTDMFDSTKVIRSGGGDVDFGIETIPAHGVMMKHVWCAPFARASVLGTLRRRPGRAM